MALTCQKARNLFTICHVNVYNSKPQNIVLRCKAINVYITRDPRQVHMGSMANARGIYAQITRNVGNYIKMARHRFL